MACDMTRRRRLDGRAAPARPRPGPGRGRAGPARGHASPADAPEAVEPGRPHPGLGPSRADRRGPGGVRASSIHRLALDRRPSRRRLSPIPRSPAGPRIHPEASTGPAPPRFAWILGRRIAPGTAALASKWTSGPRLLVIVAFAGPVDHGRPAPRGRPPRKARESHRAGARASQQGRVHAGGGVPGGGRGGRRDARRGGSRPTPRRATRARRPVTRWRRSRRCGRPTRRAPQPRRAPARPGSR